MSRPSLTCGALQPVCLGLHPDNQIAFQWPYDQIPWELGFNIGILRGHIIQITVSSLSRYGCLTLMETGKDIFPIQAPTREGVGSLFTFY